MLVVILLGALDLAIFAQTPGARARALLLTAISIIATDGSVGCRVGRGILLGVWHCVSRLDGSWLCKARYAHQGSLGNRKRGEKKRGYSKSAIACDRNMRENMEVKERVLSIYDSIPDVAAGARIAYFARHTCMRVLIRSHLCPFQFI